MDPEIWEDCNGETWDFWIELFLPLVNNRDGYFVHWPFEGAYMDQPPVTMNVLKAVQVEYFRYLAEVYEKARGHG